MTSAVCYTFQSVSSCFSAPPFLDVLLTNDSKMCDIFHRQAFLFLTSFSLLEHNVALQVPKIFFSFFSNSSPFSEHGMRYKFRSTCSSFHFQAALHVSCPISPLSFPGFSPSAFVFLDNGEECTLTYAELNDLTDRMARALREFERPENASQNLVAVCMKPSHRLPTVLLAIMKAGMAYLPLDAEFPMSRVKHVLQEAKPFMVLIEEGGKRLFHSPLLLRARSSGFPRDRDMT